MSGTVFNFCIGKRTQRMGDNNRFECCHTKRSPLNIDFILETHRYDDGRWNAFRFQAYRVVRTARGTGASIANGGDHDITFCGDLGNELRRGVPRKALFLVMRNQSKRDFLFQQQNDFSQKLATIPLGVIQHAQTHPFKGGQAWRQGFRFRFNNSPGIVNK